MTPPEESSALDDALQKAAEDLPEPSDDETEGRDEAKEDVSEFLARLEAQGPPRAPWSDPGVDEVMGAAGPPPWLGMRWREIPPEQQPEAWIGLRRWVDWLVAEFSLPKSIVPPCWYLHSGLVAELHAAMNMEYKVWEEGAPTPNPMMMWLSHLDAMRNRLRTAVADLGTCSQGTHQDAPAVRLDYDEEAWLETVRTRTFTRSVDRPPTTSSSFFVRAHVTGQVDDVSSPAGQVKQQDVTAPLSVHLGRDNVGGAEDMQLRARVTGGHDPVALVWETAREKDGQWSDLDADTDEGKAMTANSDRTQRGHDRTDKRSERPDT